jgi:apolipoprotein D and lipocalin family protein
MKNIFKSRERHLVDIATVRDFDLSKYLGTWYEIARYDHRFESGLTEVKAEYTLLLNGMIKVVNSGFNTVKGKRSEIIGKAKTTAFSGLLRVSFFWFFYSDYRVLALGDNYAWSLVGGGCSDKYLWILSRTETLPEETLSAILSEAERRGYDTKRLIFNEKK